MYWWVSKGYVLHSLPKEVVADLLCAYARLNYVAMGPTRLVEPAPLCLVVVLEQALTFVPKSHHAAILALPA